MKNISQAVTRYSGHLFFLWLLLSFTLTHIPIPETGDGLPHVDKLTHVVIYAVLTLLLLLWWNKKEQVKTNSSFLVFIVLLVYALVDEYLQSFVGRTPDIRDIVADIVGIVIGWLLFYRVRS